jgi:hypothetical protein
MQPASELQTSITPPTCSLLETLSGNPSTWSCIRKADEMNF